jgi:acetyltransferase
LAIVTNAGGPGVLATDALVSGGGEIAKLADDTKAALDKILPPHWSHNNPVDVLGDAGADRYAKAVEIVAADPNSDGLLIILTPQDMTDPTTTAQQLCKTAATIDKPLLTSWMGAETVAEGNELLNRAGIPTFEFPDSAVRAFNYMWRHGANLKLLYETPTIGEGSEKQSLAQGTAVRAIEAAQREGRTILTESESKELLRAYGLPVTPTYIARTADEALKVASDIGYPVVLKLLSRTITHKTDVGGVELNLKDTDAVARAFESIRRRVGQVAGDEHFDGVTVQKMVQHKGMELILGSTSDAQFGPVLMFGLGGQMVEVFKDRALALPPLNDVLARRMMERTKVYAALKGVRGQKPVDMTALEQVMVQFSRLVLDQPWIKEIEINPLLASPQGLTGLDARVLLHDPATPQDQLPRPAIRPYPSQYSQSCRLADGSEVTLRPIRPEDEPRMVRFHQSLSNESVRLRYFCSMSVAARTAHERLVRVCFGDYDRQVALVATRFDEAEKRDEIVAVGRLSRVPGTSDAEFAIVIGDHWQRRGLGTILLQSVLRVARAEGIRQLAADILSINAPMLQLCRKCGFSIRHVNGDGIARAGIDLQGVG